MVIIVNNYCIVYLKSAKRVDHKFFHTHIKDNAIRNCFCSYVVLQETEQFIPFLHGTQIMGIQKKKTGKELLYNPPYPHNI